MHRHLALTSTLIAVLATASCSKKDESAPAVSDTAQRATATADATTPSATADSGAPAQAAAQAPEPAEEDEGPGRGLVLALSQRKDKKPGPARAEVLFHTQKTNKWETVAFEDPTSKAFFKVMPLLSSVEETQLITLGGSKAAVKGWRRDAEGFKAVVHWSEAFGGKVDRMRDAEVGDVNSDNAMDIVVGTHDQGVLAFLKRNHKKLSEWQLEKLDRQRNLQIDEVELGDLDRDGKLEIYVLGSEVVRPKVGGASARVLRYVPTKNEKRTVVADLGARRASEILVHDVDGDGSDELYVAVEAQVAGPKGQEEFVDGVEILRFGADTKPTEGALVARIPDLYCRFLTVGDIDADGHKELVATGARSGVWLLKHGGHPEQAWSVQNIDERSTGAEHAALLADLDENGRDELYVAADNQGEVRRYVWSGDKIEREVILKRDDPTVFTTYNITMIGR